MAEKSTLERIKHLGLLNSEQLRKHLSISQATLNRLAKSGDLRRLSYGLYVHPEVEIPPQDVDFAVACAKFGAKSAIGGLSALFHYGLLEQPPAQSRDDR